MSSTSKSIIEHISELRTRLLRSLIAVGITSTICLVFAKEIFNFLQKPMLDVLPENHHFIATTPFESYVVYFKVALLCGILSSTPILFYHIWKFITPALSAKEKKLILPASIMSGLLFSGGALFGYFIVFPTGFYYVNLILADTSIQLLPKMSDYLNIVSMMLISFGVMFELPLFIFLLGKLGLLSYSHLKSIRRYVIVALFVIAAILTPGPDVLLQCMLAFPLWILFELGGLTLIFIERKRAKELKELYDE